MIKKTKLKLLCFPLILLGICSISSAEIIDRIVAVVNNEIITLSQLNKAANPYKRNIEASGKSGEEKKIMFQTLEKEMLQQLIDRSLTAQEAVKYNIDVVEEDVDNAINNFMATKQLDQEGLEAALASEGVSYKEYRAKMKGEIVQSMLINRAVRSQVIITDSDIKTYYDAHGEMFSGMK